MSGIDINNLPQEAVAYIKALQAENAELKDRNSELKSTVEKQSLQISNLNEMLVKGRKKMFGKSSEQLKYVDGAEQLSLFNEAEQESAASSTEPTEKTLVEAHERRKKRTKAEMTENLPHKEVLCEIENPVCDVCGANLVKVGKELVRSELNIVPEQIYIIDYYRAVYKCVECEEKGPDYKPSFKKAETPAPMMKKSQVSAGTVAYVLQQKYMLGIPLYRQQQYWKAQGVELSRTTLANWIIRSSRLFAPLVERMRVLLLQEEIIHADETEVRVLKRDGRQVDGVSRQWVFCSGQHSKRKMSLYYYRPTRSGKVVTEILGDYSGYIQNDGYAAYNAAVKAIRVGCWAHAKRKWNECLPKGIEDKNSKAAQALALVEKLFSADKRLVGLPSNEIYEQRLKILKPILDEYWQLLESIDAPGDSNLDKAKNYSLNNRKELEAFLLDGRLELTNNRAERAVKPFVIGRKNWLFSDTDKGADSSAMCYSLIESAKLNGLDTYGYLIHLLTELPKLGAEPSDEQLDSLMPWAALPQFCYL